MNIEVKEESEVKEKFKEVGAEVPDGVSVVPSGKAELDSRQFIVYPDEAETIRKLLEQSGVESVSKTEEDTSTLVLRSEDLVLPSIYIAYITIKNNWDQIEFGLEKIFEYYMKRFDQDIEMSIEVEQEDGNTTRVTYRGPPEEFEGFSNEVSSIVGVEVEDERES